MASLTVDYFDRVYASSDDPWGFASRWYERRKRQLTMASLPREEMLDGRYSLPALELES